MDQRTYADTLRAVLDAHRQAAATNLRACLAALPEKTTDIGIVVSPDQDGEGYVSIFVTLGGPDLYVLNKAIRDHFRLIDLRPSPRPDPLRPPMMDPDEAAFSVPDTIVDTALTWVRDLWTAEIGQAPVPASAFGDDGYGTLAPLPLSP